MDRTVFQQNIFKMKDKKTLANVGPKREPIAMP